MSTSKLQRKFSKALSIHFGAYTIRENSRPEWCISDDFQRLELDFYLPDLNMAVEIQGQQHYVFTPLFHENYEDFQAQQKRDAAKRRRCQDYGVRLLEVDDDLSFEEAIECIREIEKALAIKQRKPIAPEQWALKLQALNGGLVKLWNSRSKIPRPKLTGLIGSKKAKLLSIIDTYGMGVFQYTNEETAQSIFWHTQKLLFWTKTH